MLLLVFSILFSIQIGASDIPNFSVPERFMARASMLDVVDIILHKYNSMFHVLDIAVGFPNYPPPIRMQTTLANAATSKDFALSQYAPRSGHPRLLKAISKLYSTLLKRTLQPDDNILITIGATEALFLSFSTYTFPGDEWIVFEPFYDPYLPTIKAANGILRPIELKLKVNNADNFTSVDWIFDREKLSRLFNKKTRGILINTPHNPTGKMFTLEELTFIADLARKWNALVVFDEVYQFLTYDNNEHIRISTLPGMFERTIAIGSASKTFGATGYRIGWAYGSKELIENLKRVHSLTVLNAPTPSQEAVAVGLEDEFRDYGKPYSFIERLKRETQANRDYLYRILNEIGMTSILPQGGYFMIANWTRMGKNIVLDSNGSECKDFRFFKWLLKSVKVLGSPLSSNYFDIDKCSGKDLLHFTVIKDKKTYKKVEKRFAKWLIQQ